MRILSAQVNALKHQRAWLLAGCVILVPALVCCFRLFFEAGPSEPVYRGLGLSRWLDGSTVIRTSPGYLSSAKAMSDVIQSVGPEALPLLVGEVEQSGRPGLKDIVCQCYVRLWLKSGLIRSWLPRPSSGPRSEIALYNSMVLLGRLAPGSSHEAIALRAIIAARQNGNRPFFEQKLRVLGCFTNSPKEVIPILVAELNNAAYVETAAKALQNFGSSATPTLYPIALKETGLIRPAEYALEKADAGAYRRLREEKDQLGLR